MCASASPRSRLALVTVVVLLGAFAAPRLRAQGPLGHASDQDTASALIREMVGTWDVQQRMWPARDVEPIPLSRAIAHRQMIAQVFLQEVLTPVPAAAGESFTRIAYINYNAVNRQLEYVSLDTRAPQLMTEKSEQTDAWSILREQHHITLNGGSFVAPEWGPSKNATFGYRLVLGAVQRGQQTVRLYLTPQSQDGAREFLAFEYVYTRRR